MGSPTLFQRPQDRSLPGPSDVVAMPLVAITTTYLYFDLLVTERQEAGIVGSGAVLPAEI
jgi:hypothetical protein